jgi:predicted DNA-binding ribbon-helix-helix protein
MRHVRVGKDNTTITLEDEFWEQLRIIAITRNVAISQLLAEIDRTMRLQPARPGYRRVRTLSAAVRVFVLQTLISPPSSGKRRACARSPRSPWSLPPRDASKQGGQDRVRTLSAAARSSTQRSSACSIYAIANDAPMARVVMMV